MNPEDLRIGNWVNESENNVDIQITLKDFYFMFKTTGYIPHSWKPIPLTEQWLKDFSWNDKGEGFWDFDQFRIVLNFASDAHALFIHIDGKLRKIAYLNHVHTFQNLIYTLTGIELKKEF